MTIVLIDGDSIAYRAGYAEEWEHAKQSIDNCMCRILDRCETNKYELYLEEWRTKKKNFRKDVFNGYKNRPPSTSIPTQKQGKDEVTGIVNIPHLTLAREYLLETWNARVSPDGYESEDVCIIRAHELKGDCIVAAIDKDVLKNYPFKMYNYVKDEFTCLTKDEARANLYRQVLTGDRTDSIAGLQGVGPKGAERLITVDDPEPQYTCAKAYKDMGHSYDYFIQQFNLIYIREQWSTEILYPVHLEEWEML